MESPSIPNLWSKGAAQLLGRATRLANVFLITGSEQIQTEECVRLLADRGVLTERIFVRGSLYGFDPTEQRFTGAIGHLNVTLEGKRDAVESSVRDCTGRILGAVGNSRPDRALFEAVDLDGFCCLVCPHSVLRKRKVTTFVIRKLRRSGYRIFWSVPEFLRAVCEYRNAGGESERPILATDHDFTNVLRSRHLKAAFLNAVTKEREDSPLLITST